MKITEHKNPFETTYQILIEPADNLNAFDICECFANQYPHNLCVVVFKETEIKFGFILVGLK